MAPYPSANGLVVVTCIAIDGAGKATISWSQSLPTGFGKTPGQPITLPAALNMPNTSIIPGEMTYAYTPAIDFIHMGEVNLYSSVYIYPRISAPILLP
jgi:hypothetical protein